nr:hypothetical protein [Tanacetum cinerariifolium]
MNQNFNYSNSFGFDQYQPQQFSVTQQLPQRSNENIRLEIAKLIKNNRILFNNNIYPDAETSMSVLLAKERILKLIQAWDKKQIKSWSLPELLLQLSNDSQTIDEMLKQREQATNLSVQEKQEEQAAQTWERFSKIKHAFTDKQYQPEDIQELICKLLEDVRNINEELSDYTNSSSWNRPIFYDNDEHSREYLEKSSKAITPEEPEYSLSMGDEHLSTISETESDELIKSSVENLVPISSESKVTFDNETINSFPRPLLIRSLRLFPHLLFPLRIVTILGKRSIYLPAQSDDYDSERDIHFLEELRSNDFIPLPENESSNFGHHADPSSPRPPLKPQDVEVFFDFESNSGELIPAVMNNIDELFEDECFDPGGGEIDVFSNIVDDDYFPFIFFIQIFQPYLIYPEVSPLLLST